MELTDSQKKLIESAIHRFGVTGLARELGVSRYVFYEIRRRGRGLTPDKLEKIQQLMLSKAKEMPGNAPGVAIETPPSETALERQLIAEWTLRLSKDELAKVIAFIAEIKASRPGNSYNKLTATGGETA